MEAIAYRLRAEVRRSWRSALALVVLIGLLGGATLAAVAGARRTASAYPRLLEEVDAAELLVSPPGESGADVGPFYDELAALPGVRRIGVVGGVPALPMAGTRTARIAERVDSAESLDVGAAMASLDGRAFVDIERPRLLEGRAPDPERADEVLVSWRLARTGNFEVGDTLDFVVVTDDRYVDQVVAEPSQGRPIRVTVTGIGVLSTEVIPFSDLDELGTMVFAGPVLEGVPRAAWAFEGVVVDVEPGADVPALAQAIERLGAESELTGGPVFVSDQQANAREVQDGLRPLAVALVGFAVVVGLVSLFVVGQAISRHTRLPADEAAALSALGVIPRQAVAVTLARAVVLAVAGALVAVALAMALSPRFPNGPARVAEPDPGLRVDWPVLAIGGLAIVVASIAAVLPAALLRTRRAATPRRSSVVVSSTAVAAGLPAPAVQGIRFALDRGAEATRAPVRSTLVSVAAAIAAVVAAATFATSLGLLVDTPARYGQGWDRLIDAQFSPVAAGLLVDRYGDDRRVDGIAAGAYAEVAVGEQRIPAVTMLPVKGGVGLTVVEGRRADGPGEVAFGGEVLADLGLDVGDRVELDGGDGEPRTMRVVGEVVFPRFNQGSFGQTGLGLGAQLHPDALAPLEAPAEDGPVPPGVELDGRFHHFIAFDLADDPGALDAELRSLVEDEGIFAFVRSELPPTTISDLDRVRSVPVVLAVILSLAAAAVLGHLIVSAVRSHRRDFGVLATCGFVPRQLRAAVGWHATAVALVCSAIGIPVGIAAGRALWSRFAADIYVGSAAAVPWWWVALAAPVAVVVANVVAAVPGSWAARTRPATALREA